MGCPSSPISFICLNFFKVQGTKKMPQPNLGFTSLAKHESAAKFLPSYLNYSPSGSAVCLWQRQWEILSVGSTEPGHLLQSASTPPAPPIDVRENIQPPPFRVHYGPFTSNSSIPAYTICLPTVVAASSRSLLPILWRSFPSSVLKCSRTGFTEFPIVVIFCNSANNSSAFAL